MSSRQIDYRVVELAFDNAKFEQNVSTSLTSLDKLNKSLDLSESASRMSASAAIITGAFLEIGAKAVDLGAKLAKAVTVDPLLRGLASYEEQIGSVQVIMNATGKSITNVENILDRLVWFADETSYSMDQMSSATSRFVSNNVDLNVSATAIQGIANMAALAGVSGQRASIAFNNMADAIAKGGLVAQDFKSLELAGITTTEFKKTAIEAAIAVGALGKSGEILKGSMKGTIVTLENFKQTLAADASGMWFTNDVILKQADAFGAYASAVYAVQEATELQANAAIDLVDQLQSGVLSAEEFSERFADLSETDVASVIKTVGNTVDELGRKAFLAAQESKTLSDSLNYTRDALASGWAGTWKLIFGNYEEAKVVFTGLSDLLYEVFVASGDARNELLGVWRANQGREALLLSLDILIHNIKTMIQPIRDAFRDIFDALDGEKLAELTKSFLKLVASFKMETETAENLRRTFRGLFAVIDIGVSFAKEFVKFFGKLIGVFSPAAGGILELTGGIGDFLTSIRDTIKEGKVFEGFFNTILSVIIKVKEFLAPLGELVKKAFSKVGEVLVSVAGSFKSIFTGDMGATTFTEKIKAIFNGLVEFFKGIGAKFGDVFKTIGQHIRDTAGVDADAGFMEIAKGLLKHMPTLDMVVAMVKSTFEQLALSLQKFWPVVKDVWAILGPIFNEMLDTLKTALGGMDLGSFLNFINSVLNIGLIGTMMKLTGVTADAVKGIDKIADSVAKAIDKFSKVFTAAKWSMYGQAAKSFAIAIGILAASLIALSFVDIGKLAVSIGFLTVLIGELVGALYLISKIGETSLPGMAGVAIGVIGLATAMLILSAAVKKIGEMNFLDALQGVVAIGILMLELVAVTKILSGMEGNLSKLGLTFILLSTGLLLLSHALTKYASMNLMDMVLGLIEISVVMTTLGLVMRTFPKNNLLIIAGGLTVLSIALNTLAGTMFIFSKLSLETLAKGLGAIVATLLALGLALKVVDLDLKTATGILIMAAALTALVVPILLLKSVAIEDIAKGILSVAATLGILVAAVKFMGDKEIGSLKNLGIALSSFALGFKVLSSVMKGMDLELFVKTLAASTIAVLLMKVVSSSQDQGKGAMKGAIAMLLVFGGLAAVFLVLQNFGDVDAIGKIAISLSGVLLSMALMLDIISDIGKKKMGKALGTLFVITGVMVGVGAVLTVMAKILGDTDPKTLMASAISLSLLMLALGETVKIISTIHGNKKMTSAVAAMAQLALIMVIVGTILGAVASFTTKPEALIPTAAALSLVMIALSAAVKIMGTIDGTMAEGLIGTMMVLGLVMSGLAVVMGWVSTFANAEAMIPIALAIGVLANALAIAIAILGTIDGTIATSTIVTMAIMGVLMGGFGALLGWLSTFTNVEKVIPIAVGIGLLAIALGAAVKIIASIPSVSLIAGTKVIVLMLILVALVGTLMLGLGALYDKLGGTMEKGVEMMRMIGDGIGQFVGAIIAGVAGAVIGLIPKIGQALTDFMNNAQGFVDGARKIDGAVLAGVSILALTLLEIMAVNVLDGLTRFIPFKSNFKDIGDKLANLGEALVRFYESTEGVSGPVVKQRAEALSLLMGALGDIPSEGGWLDKIFGSQDLNKIDEHITEIGNALNSFYTTTADITKASVDNATECLVTVFEALKTAPKDGGLLGALFGHMKLDKLDENIVGISGALVTFSKTGNALGDDGRKSIEDTASTMEKLFTSLSKAPVDGGLTGAIFGNKKLDKLGGTLTTIGRGLVVFSEDSVKLNHTSIDLTSATILTLFTSLSNAPVDGGLTGVLYGTMNLDKLGAMLITLGEGLKSFSDSAVEINHNVVKTTGATIETLFTSLCNAPNIYVVLSPGRVDNIINVLASLATSLVTFGDTVDRETRYNVLIGASTLTTLFTTLAMLPTTLNLDDLARQLKDLGQGIKEYGAAVGTDLLTTLADSAPAIESITTFMEALLSALTTGLETLRTSESLRIKMEELVTAMAGMLTTPNNLAKIMIASETLFSAQRFVPSGQNVVAGLVQGIEDNASKVNLAMVALANGMIYALNTALDINSPSGKTEQSADYTVDGYVLGIKKGGPKVFEAGERMGNLALEGLNEGLEQHSVPRDGGGSNGIGQDTATGYTEGLQSQEERVAAYTEYWTKKNALNPINEAASDWAEGSGAQNLSTDLNDGVSNALDASGPQVEENAENWFDTRIGNPVLGKAQQLKEKLEDELGFEIDLSSFLPEGATQYLSGDVLPKPESLTPDIENEMSKAGSGAGSSFSKGAATGIKKEKSPEEAAREKAEAIVAKFSAGLSKLSDVMSILDQEYQLFEKAYGYVDPNDEKAVAAKEAALLAKELEIASQKLTLQQEKAQTAQEAYNETLLEFGDDSEYTRARLTELNNEMMTYYDMLNKVDEIQREMNKPKEEEKYYASGTTYVTGPDGEKRQYREGGEELSKIDKHTEYLLKQAEIAENMAKIGMTISDEDIRKAAASAVGYSADWLEKAEEQVESAVVKSLQNVSTVWAENTDDTLGKLTYNYEKIGVSYGESTATGMIYGGEDVINTAKMIAVEGAKTFERYRPLWVEAGAFLGQGLVDGILSKLDAIAAAGTQAGAVALHAVRTALALGSPSKATTEYGKFVDEGLAIGITKYAHVAEVAAEEMGTSTLDRLRDVLNALVNSVDSDMDLSPTITPVIDIEATKRQVAALNAMLDQSVQVSPTIEKAKQIASHKASPVETANQNGSGVEKVKDITFIQNNNSPKALSRIDLYRQTKNQLSAAKGLVNR